MFQLLQRIINSIPFPLVMKPGNDVKITFFILFIFFDFCFHHKQLRVGIGHFETRSVRRWLTKNSR